MYLITGILIYIFLFSFYKEPRRLRNGILFIFVLGFSYLSIMELMNAIGLTIIMSIMVLFLIFGIPFIIFISGFFLIGNGIILLRKA